MDYRKMLEDGFTNTKAWDECLETRYQYLADHVFDFTTYDGEISDELGRKAVEVCRAINDGRTFDFIADEGNYRWFVVMCNMPFFADKLSWGTSIRGAWWDTPLKFSAYGLYDGADQIAETLTMNDSEWKAFIAALIEFAESQPVS